MECKSIEGLLKELHFGNRSAVLAVVPGAKGHSHPLAWRDGRSVVSLKLASNGHICTVSKETFVKIEGALVMGTERRTA